MAKDIIEEFMKNQAAIREMQETIIDLKNKNNELIKSLNPVKVDQAIEIINSKNLNVVASKLNSFCIYITSDKKLTKDIISEIFYLIPNYSFSFETDKKNQIVGIYYKDMDSIDSTYEFINSNF